MRKFKGLVFLGSGLHSLAERARLHRRLDEALDLSGGMQQPQHWDHEPTQADREATERVDRESVQEVEDACRDLVAALVGRDISFGETLPYPASDSDPPPPVDLCDAGSRPAIMDSPDGPFEFLASSGGVASRYARLADPLSEPGRATRERGCQ